MTTTNFDPALVRKAAAFVTKLDGLFDEFGIRFADGQYGFRFGLVSGNDAEGVGPRFEAVGMTGRDAAEPTGFTIGFVA